MDRTLRLLLAMLALVAGLAGAPAQARMTPADTAEIERVDAGRAPAATSSAAVQGEIRAQTRRDNRDPDRTKGRRPGAVIVLIPSIQYTDRLLE